MRNLLIIATCFLTLASCKNSGSTDTATTDMIDSTATEPAAPSFETQTACYFRAEGRDTTWISLNIAADGTVTGSYDWAPHETHGASGTVTGKKEGEMLNLMYDYTIEGSNQQQEMVLKMTGDQLAEGEGELTEGEGGVLKIKDATKLTWQPFVKMDCK